MHTNTAIIAKIQFQNSAMQEMGNGIDDEGTMQPSKKSDYTIKLLY